MMKVYLVILIAMYFLHIVDDFYLQGVLANMKMKEWWAEHAPHQMYANDYYSALAIHGSSWSIMIHIPYIVCGFIYAKDVFMLFVIVSIIINAIIHAYVDNLKANKRTINLLKDQQIHILQIVGTFIVLLVFLEVFKL